MFNKRELRVSLEKTEVPWFKDLDIRLNKKKLKQRDSFVSLAGAMSGDGSSEAVVRGRIQAGESAWKKLEGVKGNI